jgi:hypothetical protein
MIVDVDSRWSTDYHKPGAAARLQRVVERYAPGGVSHYLRRENDGCLTLELVREHAPVPGPELPGVLGETLWRVLNGRGLRQ